MHIRLKTKRGIIYKPFYYTPEHMPNFGCPLSYLWATFLEEDLDKDEVEIIDFTLRDSKEDRIGRCTMEELEAHMNKKNIQFQVTSGDSLKMYVNDTHWQNDQFIPWPDFLIERLKKTEE